MTFKKILTENDDMDRIQNNIESAITSLVAENRRLRERLDKNEKDMKKLRKEVNAKT